MMVKLSAANPFDQRLAGPRAAAEAVLGPPHSASPGGSRASAAPSRQGAGGEALGPLGEFLLGRWREDEANERALMARAGRMGFPGLS